jgi:hypothetical protein
MVAPSCHFGQGQLLANNYKECPKPLINTIKYSSVKTTPRKHSSNIVKKQPNGRTTWLGNLGPTAALSAVRFQAAWADNHVSVALPSCFESE